MPASESDLQALAAYQAVLERIRQQLAVRVRVAWGALGSWDVGDVPLFAARVDPVAVAARRSMVAVVDSYTARLSRTRPLGLTADLAPQIASPRAVEPLDLWRRPFVEHWGALSGGSEWRDAYSLGRARAVTLAEQDLQRVTDMAMDRVMEVHEGEDLEPLEVPPESLDVDDDFSPRRIVGYRRVLTGRSCLFCAAASTQVYRRGNLRPLHGHCDCGIAPIFADSDPGGARNAELLAELKARGPEYWRRSGVVESDFDPESPPEGFVRVEHVDEVGPMLITA